MLSPGCVPLQVSNVTHFLLSLPPGVRLRNYKNNVKRRREQLQNLKLLLTLLLLYSHAPHNDVPVNDGLRVRR